MATIQDIFGTGTSLKASDLPVGIQVPCVIESVRALQFDDGNKLELNFVNKEKVLICNKTNANRIADQHGDDYTLWVGKAICLMADKTDFRGEIVPCVRVVISAVATQQTPTPVQQLTPPSDDIPF